MRSGASKHHNDYGHRLWEEHRTVAESLLKPLLLGKAGEGTHETLA